MTTPPDVLAGSATGSIYDLGYRRYDGPRLGRRHAIGALFVHGLRAAFGLGRSGRAKIAPLVLGGLIALPAVVSVGFGALAGGAAAEFNPITLEGYLTFAQTLLVFFVAAQAPELLVRDQRHRVLTLYFSRALERADYVLAKYLALLAAVALVFALPQVILLLGMLFATPSLTDGLAEVVPARLAGGRPDRRGLGAPRRRRAGGQRLHRSPGRSPPARSSRPSWSSAASSRSSSTGSASTARWPSWRWPTPSPSWTGSRRLLFGVEPNMPAILRSDLPVWLFAASAVAVSARRARAPPPALPADRGVTAGVRVRRAHGRLPLVRQRRRRQRRRLLARGRRHRPPGPERGGQVDAPPHDRRAPAAVGRHRHRRRPGRPTAIRRSSGGSGWCPSGRPSSAS